MKLKIVILGLSITSSWGNGHATTYRGLARALATAGHKVVFLERDVPWYADNRDYPKSKFCKIGLYRNVRQLQTQFAETVRAADLVIVGSYVPDGILIGEWVANIATGVTAFYDIDTPVTLAKLRDHSCDYLSPELISQYQLYLSFTGGPILEELAARYNSPMVRALYCSVDPALYSPSTAEKNWALGYLGTYSNDRQPGLQRLLLDVALRIPEQKFVVAGPQYPNTIIWPRNVARVTHLAPTLHRGFYNEQNFTLNLTRADMKRAGYSPSVRLFEAAACGVPIISDYWEGIESFFEPEKEILIARSTEDAVAFLQEFSPTDRWGLGTRARQRVLKEHTADHRVATLEGYFEELRPVAKKQFRAKAMEHGKSKIIISRKAFYESV